MRNGRKGDFMTDKQIIDDDQKKTIHRLQDECTEKTNAIIALGKNLKIKEQEYEKLKAEQTEIKKYLGISHKTILERLEELTEFRDRDSDEILQLQQQLDQLKKRLRYYECDEAIIERDNYIEELLQTLTEIKDVLNFYANSKIGEQQEDGTYKILLNGDYITIYNPNPAKKALQKIKEVENE